MSKDGAIEQGESGERLFNLRVVPWWTDGCSTFLDNIFKWLPQIAKRPLTVLEFGGGNSTFYLLKKGLKVVTVESEDAYIDFVCGIAERIGYRAIQAKADDFSASLFSSFDLIAVKAGSIADTSGVLGRLAWDFVVNDGVSRREVLQQIHRQNIPTVLILDNVEYCANWGRLDRSSAKPDLIRAYRAMLRDPNWRGVLFEQPEGRDGRGGGDKTGWESPHRWVSSVLWPAGHLFAKLMVTHLGMPLVNELGIEDADVETLKDRCPFDWKRMQWLRPAFPAELDLKLDRGYD